MSMAAYDYSDFARLNREWPADYAKLIGRLVRLNFKMENARRQAFVRGTVMCVADTSVGALDCSDPLFDLARLQDRNRAVLNCVSPMYLTLEPEWYKPCLDCEGIGRMLECSPSGSYPDVEVPCRTCKGSKQGRRATDAKG